MQRWRFLVIRDPRIKETVVRIDESIREAFSQRIVKDAQQRGEINAGLDPDAVARVLMAFWDGLVLQKTLDPTADIWKYGTRHRLGDAALARYGTDTVIALYGDRPV